jgi:hypothetical protein
LFQSPLSIGLSKHRERQQQQGDQSPLHCHFQNFR